MVESAASDNGLPVAFFARVIWHESRFNADAVGPRTRSGAHAEGIAQFMPGTASERQLLDPFDPVQALPKAAAFLRELRSEFGNLGLAAAAYNAGPQRVRDWLAGKRDLPGQTRAYVRAITDRSAEDWAHGDTQSPAQSSPNCQAIVATLKRDGGRFIASLEQHVTIANAQPWGAQLSAGFSRERALGDYARIMQRLGAAIGERDPMITSAVMRSRGTSPFYQVRIGAQTRQEADDLCKQIHRAGTACVVWRTAKAGRSAVAQSSGSSLTIEAP
ncbi:MAG TPA: lytic transglycosylase domain-containing protein [Pseudolabrys sp.]|nr:lytic transglycosylase domain-containing protein [Pseudolabrys sp.]